MKVINSKLAAIGLAAFVFASCSDSNSDPTNTGSTPAKVDASTIDLTSNSGESLMSNVINYKNTTANARKFFGTRAANDANFATTFDMPKQKNTDTQECNYLR